MGCCAWCRGLFLSLQGEPFAANYADPRQQSAPSPGFSRLQLQPWVNTAHYQMSLCSPPHARCPAVPQPDCTPTGRLLKECLEEVQGQLQIIVFGFLKNFLSKRGSFRWTYILLSVDLYLRGLCLVSLTEFAEVGCPWVRAHSFKPFFSYPKADLHFF